MPVDDTTDPLALWLDAGGLSALDFATCGALDVVGIIDPQLVVRYVNWTAPGLSRESVIGSPVLDLAPPGFREVSRQTYLKVLETGEGSRFEVAFEGEQGLLLWEVRVGAICSAGAVIGLLTISTEITEQRRAEADRDRFFSLSRDMFVVLNPEGRLKRFNPALGEMLGYQMEELVDRPFIDFVHADDLPQTRAAFADLTAGRSVTSFENRYLRRGGASRVFSWRGTVDPITGDIYAVARDITDQRETESQLRHSQKLEAVGQLAGGVAHDFNNLMQAVLANAELAKPTAAQYPEVIERLRCIEDAAQRAAALTKGLLAFSRRQPLRLGPVDLNALTHATLKVLRRLLPENITVEFVPAEELLCVSGDQAQLEQVVVNLAINARDAMERGGKLLLTTAHLDLDHEFCSSHDWAKPGRWVMLRVADTGSGMPPEVQERIFEPFFTTKGPHRGTGLGLATVYGIVRQHGGMTDVSSLPSVGTTFTIYLPADGGRMDTDVVGSSAQPQPVARGKETILVAEDEASVRQVLVEMLQESGYHPVAAASGAEAVRLLREYPGDVGMAILDIIMPELDGPETWEHLRALRPDLRVLFISGYAGDDHRARLPPGAELLAKPFRTQHLLERVRAILDR